MHTKTAVIALALLATHLAAFWAGSQRGTIRHRAIGLAIEPALRRLSRAAVLAAEPLQEQPGPAQHGDQVTLVGGAGGGPKDPWGGSKGSPQRKLTSRDADRDFPAAHHRGQGHAGFYVPPGKEHLVEMALKDPVVPTDKVTGHNYQTIYGRLFELSPGRARVHKLLEIGLGCRINQGPAVGSSARLWRKYFPHADVWFAEYDEECIAVRQKELEAINIKVVTGDQEDPPTLKRWVKETGGNFDLIIDDGGHSNAQQFQSFMHLFQHALKPGGVYVIEDLGLSKGPPHTCGGNPRCAIMSDVITQWVEQLIMGNCERMWPSDPEKPPYMPKAERWHGMVPGLKTIECSAEACAFIKCFVDDPRCFYPACVDAKLAAHSPWNRTA